MTLEEIINNIYDQDINPVYKTWDIESINSDSRKVKRNSLFVALKGSAYDGDDFVPEAIAKGAKVIVTESEDLKADKADDVCFLRVKNADQFLRQIATNFYQEPSKKVKTIGITGTNGKTTISYLIEAILREASFDCGVIGTVNYRIGEKKLPSVNTTPALLDSQDLLLTMAEEGVEYCIMEVSSHALDQGRTDLIDFHTAVFTNLTGDHLDYHKTMEQYFNAKSKLFTDLESDATSVINCDDRYGRKLISKTSSKVVTYGIENNAQVMARDIQLGITDTRFKLTCEQGEAIIRTNLVGIYNVYNILAATAVCLNDNIGLEKIVSAVGRLKMVPGRLESVDCQQDFSIFIDYAHTQDALENVLKAIRAVRDSKIIIVFGCGGNRDKLKRKEMGMAACHLADYSIVTTDNPRSENPQDIITQIVEGFDNHNYEVVLEREEAIKKALSIARSGDIVLIAGKGHENYQVFKDRTIKFDERAIIRQYLRC